MTESELVRAVRTRLTWLGWLAGTAGALVVVVSIAFLAPLFAEVDDDTGLLIANLVVTPVYVLLAGIAITAHSRRHMAAALGWLVEGRLPDEREHRLTLTLALHGVKVTALAWVIGGLVFLLLNGIGHSLEAGAAVAATIWLGGETTCALVYLLSERVLRPITARALGVRPSGHTVAPGVRTRLVMAWVLGTGVPLLGVLVIGVVGLVRADVDREYMAAAVVFLALLAYGVGMLVMLFAAKAIAHPISAVRSALEGIQRGDLNVHVAVDDGSEVGQLQAGFNRMAEGLRERERIRDLFGRQVGEDVARAALRDGVKLGGEERQIGALFVDLVGSTSMAMAMPPTEVVRVLNRFFRVVVDVVEAEGGLVDKFEGDAALCVFGAPVPSDDPAGSALRAARALAGRLARDVPEVDFGIGISAGVAVAGNVGAERRFEYTVIGDPVNEAARLSELAKQRPERVLASEAALERAAARERDAWDVTDSAVLRGRSSATAIAHPRS